MTPDRIPSVELLSSRFQEEFDGIEMNGGLWPVAADRLAKVAREVMLAALSPAPMGGESQAEGQS